MGAVKRDVIPMYVVVYDAVGMYWSGMYFTHSIQTPCVSSRKHSTHGSANGFKLAVDRSNLECETLHRNNCYQRDIHEYIREYIIMCTYVDCRRHAGHSPWPAKCASTTCTAKMCNRVVTTGAGTGSQPANSQKLHTGQIK